MTNLLAQGEWVRRLSLLADRSAIEDLLAEYAAAMDGQDHDRLPDLFTEDVVVGSPAGEMVGRDEVVARLSSAVAAHFTSHHMITNVRCAIDGDRARAIGYFHSVHLDDPQRPDLHADHGGWYLAELVRGEHGWRFRRLKQVSVWTAANRRPWGPLDAAVPTELRSFLTGLGD